MRYMNRFTIGEDDQFEIAAIRTAKRYNSHQVDDFWMMESFLRGVLDEELQRVQNRTKQQSEALDQKTFSCDFSNQLHIVVVSFNRYKESITRMINHAMKKIGYKSAMISFITMWKEHCITKEEFDIEYGIKNGEEEHKADEEGERNDLSVGEDLETFFSRIKNGEVSKEAIPDMKESFLLCLLDKEELKKLERKDEHFLNTFGRTLWEHISGKTPDVDEEEWKESEYQHLKFSKSEAYRVTTFVEVEAEADQ